MGNQQAGAYIAALWEQPRLCLAFFGVQYLTPEGQKLYEESGIQETMVPSLGEAPGLLHNRFLMSEQGPVLMQYWRTQDDLQTFARTLPHTDWWRWLVANVDKGVAFYHEIYDVASGEAIYESGSLPVGPALFCATEPVPSGQGRSRERQARFAAAREAL